MVSAVEKWEKYATFNLRFATSLVYQTLALFFSTLIKLRQESDRRPDGCRVSWARFLMSVVLYRRFLGLFGIWEQIGTQFGPALFPRFHRRGPSLGVGGPPAV